MSTAAAPLPEASGSSSSLSRIVGVLFSPKPTFESILQKPTWLLPLILIMILGFATTFLYGQRVGWRSFMAKQIEESPRTANMPQDQKNQIIDQQTKYAGTIGYVFVVIFTFGGTVVIASVLLGAFNLVGGAGLKFKQSLAIVSYASVPVLVSQILGILMIFIKDPATIDIRTLVASNVGAFMPDDTSKPLLALCQSLDIFSFWIMALMGVGYCTTNPRKLSFGKAFSIVFVCWLIYLIAKVGLTAAFS